MNMLQQTARTVALATALVGLGRASAVAEEASPPVTDRQLAVMMFVDYGRNYGYQAMLAEIEVETLAAAVDRDRQILTQQEKLVAKQAVSTTDVEIARLKLVWSEKQLLVAEKNRTAVSAQYEAMKQMARHFAGVSIPRNDLYATFRRGWDAGCEKGPEEVAAMKAWVDYAEKSLERARELRRQGGESLTSVLEKEAELAEARANYENRLERLDRCREVLFPSLADIEQIGDE